MANSGTLPVAHIVWQSLRIPFIGFRRLVWDAGFLLLVTYATAVITGVFMRTPGGGPNAGGGLIYVIIGLPVYIVALLQFLVRWHHTVMSDGMAPRDPFWPHLGRLHWRYFLHALAIGAMLLVAGIILGLLATAIYPAFGVDLRNLAQHPMKFVLVTSLYGLVTNLIVMAILGRAFLMLPVVALEEAESPFRRADALCDGHWWSYTQILFAIVLVGYAFGIVEALISLALMRPGGGGMMLLMLKVGLGPVIGAISLAVFANAVTLAYKHLLLLEGGARGDDAAMPES